MNVCIYIHSVSYFYVFVNMYVHMYIIVTNYFITGVPNIVPNVTVRVSGSTNGNNVTITLSWGEPFNNLDPIVNYFVSCSGDVKCPPNFTTTDSITRSYTITNLTPMTSYTFSVVATNSIGSGEASVVMITTPGKVTDTHVCIMCKHIYNTST